MSNLMTVFINQHKIYFPLNYFIADPLTGSINSCFLFGISRNNLILLNYLGSVNSLNSIMEYLE